MATLATISVSEYLRSSYEPDCDFVDGVLERRAVGEKPHSLMQGIFYSIFDRNLREWRLLPLLEQRVQTKPRNFRVPDLCLIPFGGGEDRIIRKAPFLCIEFLSPEDTLPRMLARAHEYMQMGVLHVWIIDPVARRAFSVDAEGTRDVERTFVVAGTPVIVSLSEVFDELDLRLSL